MEKIETFSEDWLLMEEKKLLAFMRDKFTKEKNIQKEKDLWDISRAFWMATEFHAWEMRDNKKDPYITHPIAVATILWEEFTHTHITARHIIWALLHDTVETDIKNYKRILQEFDSWIAQNIRALTKKSKEEFLAFHELAAYYTFIHKEKRPLLNIQELFVSLFWSINPWQEALFQNILKKYLEKYFNWELKRRRNHATFWNLGTLDEYELAIKLADRIHSLRTLENCTPEKQERIASETEKYFLHIAKTRFPHDGYRLLVWEIEKLQQKWNFLKNLTNTKIKRVLGYSQ